MNSGVILQILQIALTLEPAALNLILSLTKGLQGKADASVLAEDSSTWATILATAKKESASTPQVFAAPPPNAQVIPSK